MTSQTGKERFVWRRAVIAGVASGVLAAGLMTGFAAPTAFAQPAEPTEDNSCTGDDCAKADAAAQTDTPPAMTADEALAIIAQDYDLGEGGGQLSTLIHDVLTLRAQGFKPSNANKEAITKALDYRPNQGPLIQALKETLAYQRKLQAQMQNANTGQQPGYGFGVGQPPPGTGPTQPPGVPPDPASPGVGIFLPTG